MAGSEEHACSYSHACSFYLIEEHMNINQFHVFLKQITITNIGVIKMNNKKVRTSEKTEALSVRSFMKQELQDDEVNAEMERHFTQIGVNLDAPIGFTLTDESQMGLARVGVSSA